MSAAKCIKKCEALKVKIMELQDKNGSSEYLSEALLAADKAWFWLIKESMK